MAAPAPQPPQGPPAPPGPPAGAATAAIAAAAGTGAGAAPGQVPGAPQGPQGAGAGPGPGPGPGQAQAQAQDFDPVQRFRLLLPQLKESLQALMKVAAQNLAQNCSIDTGQKSTEGPPLQRFDKSLEEFYALCDQLELCLRLAHECLSQSFDSAKHSPALVPTAPKGGEGASGGVGGALGGALGGSLGEPPLPYTQYLPLIKAQIAGAKDIHNALLEGANKITGKITPPGAP